MVRTSGRRQYGLMTVLPAESAAPADWLLGGDDWWDLVRFGPRGFECYVRVALGAHDERNELPPAPEDEEPALRQALMLLAEHTSTPDAALAAIWEGWTRGRKPSAPELPIPHRRMLLFRGPLSLMRDAPALAWNHQGRVLQEPHLVWPDDRSWLLACEVDEEVEFTVACASDAASVLMNAFGADARLVEYGDKVPLLRS